MSVCSTKKEVKTETLVARVTPDLAQKVQNEAVRCGETDAYVIREALREYFARRDPGPASTLRESPDSPTTPAVPVAQTETSYLKRKRRKKP